MFGRSRAQKIFTIVNLAGIMLLISIPARGQNPAPAIKKPRPKEARILDPSVIDPVGKLDQISQSVSQSSKELTAISREMDELNDELARVEKERPIKVSKSALEALQKRFKETIDRSYVVEKKEKESLARNERDVENVRQALTAIQAERKAGSNRKAIMTDSEIAECLRDLNDLTSTIKSLQKSLVDDEDQPGEKSGAKAQAQTASRTAVKATVKARPTK